MHQMAADGWDVEGIEVSQSAAEKARALGYKVHCGPVETAPVPSRPYDMVVGFMVLEHLHDPVTALQQLHAWVRPGGWLVLSVPNAASVDFRFFRENWYSLELPRHLFHFTPRTLRATLMHSGWQVQRILHQRVLTDLYVSLGRSLLAAGRSGPVTDLLLGVPNSTGRIHQFFYPLAVVMSRFGQTGRMTVWARRGP
jgi:SAM-dependent methyltransferase